MVSQNILQYDAKTKNLIIQAVCDAYIKHLNSKEAMRDKHWFSSVMVNEIKFYWEITDRLTKNKIRIVQDGHFKNLKFATLNFSNNHRKLN